MIQKQPNIFGSDPASFLLWSWRISEYAPPTHKYAVLAYELFLAKDHWKLADIGKALKTGHKFSFYKGYTYL